MFILWHHSPKKEGNFSIFKTTWHKAFPHALESTIRKRQRQKFFVVAIFQWPFNFAAKECLHVCCNRCSSSAVTEASTAEVDVMHTEQWQWQNNSLPNCHHGRTLRRRRCADRHESRGPGPRRIILFLEPMFVKRVAELVLANHVTAVKRWLPWETRYTLFALLAVQITLLVHFLWVNCNT